MKLQEFIDDLLFRRFWVLSVLAWLIVISAGANLYAVISFFC